MPDRPLHLRDPSRSKVHFHTIASVIVVTRCASWKDIAINMHKVRQVVVSNNVVDHASSSLTPEGPPPARRCVSTQLLQ